jgi:hypothetical protein
MFDDHDVPLYTHAPNPAVTQKLALIHETEEGVGEIPGNLTGDDQDVPS